MEELKNRTCEIRAGNKQTKSINNAVTEVKNKEILSETDEYLLNLIAEIVVENMVRKIRNESKQRNETIKKE